jgi:hypothetical protein
MKILKLSMSNNFFTDVQLKEMKDRKTVSIHPDTAGKGISNTSQGEHFLNAARGDLFYLCISNYRIEYIGVFTDDMPFNSIVPGHEDWVERSCEILLESKNPTAYDTNLDKWWTPRNNSTCIPVPSTEIGIFQDKYLQPVFSVSIADLEALQTNYLASFSYDSIRETAGYLNALNTDQTKLYQTLNELDDITVRKLHYRYKAKSMGPVNNLRKQVLELLLNGQRDINHVIIENLKNTIGSAYQTKPFKNWKNDCLLLFPLLYDQYRATIQYQLQELAKKVISGLNIESLVNTTIFDFYGPRNQGSTGAWIALYNNRRKSQKNGKQLFIYFHGDKQLQYGLYDGLTKDRSKLKEADSFDFEQVIIELRLYIADIQADREDPMQEKIEEYIELLETSKNLIFTGAPGTGKTYLAKKIAKAFSETDDRIKLIQFHPSYDYSDFIEGIKPQDLKGGSISMKLTDGVFMEFCKNALKDEDNKYVFIIDEINRSDLSRVFGEVFSALEPDYRGENITTQYAYLRSESERNFTIPENVYLIGTMNDIDRSVESMDFALRRRFVWKEISAKDSESILDAADLDPGKIDEAKKRMANLNTAIEKEMGSTAYQIGGAYFKKLELYANVPDCFAALWKNHLEVVLTEYVRGMPKAHDMLSRMKNAYDVVI